MTIPPSVGIIGYRGFGAFCTEAYHDAHVARVVAYAGRDPQAMAATAAKYGVPHTYTDWREMARDPDVEIVHIVTPPDSHAEMAVYALNAGKHVFVDKPLATKDEDAQTILAAARANGRHVGINYVMRYNPLYRAVQAIAAQGLLGPLTHVGFENYASDEGLGDDHWFWDAQKSGGIFVEHGVHFFDIVGGIVNAPAVSVLGKTWTRDDGTAKEDRVQALVSYANGVEASFYHAFNRPGALEKQTCHFAFARGHVTLHGWTPTKLTLMALTDDAQADALSTIVPNIAFAPFDGPVRGNGQDYAVTRKAAADWQLGDPTPVYKQTVTDAMQDFAQAVRDPSHSLTVSAEDGARSLAVAVAARQSAHIHAPVEPKGD